MLDLLRVVLLCTACLCAIRARYPLGVASTSLCTLLLAAEAGWPLLFPVRPLPLSAAFALVFMGPSALPSSAPPVADDVLARGLPLVLSLALTAAGARGAFSRSSLLRPEAVEARILDRCGLALVLHVVVVGLLVVAVGLMRMISSPI